MEDLRIDTGVADNSDQTEIPESIITKPRVDADGTYRDKMGRTWETFSSAKARLKVDPHTILNNLSPDATVLNGLTSSGSPAPLHLRTEIESAVAHLLTIPKTRNVGDSGRYTARSGRRYATSTVAAAHFGVAPRTIIARKNSDEVRVLTGRNGQGRVDLYSLDDLAKDHTLKARLDVRSGKKIRVDGKGYYTDPKGRVWATVDAFYNSLPAEVKAKTTKSSILIQAQKYCSSQQAIDRVGRPNAQIFPVDELETKALALFNAKMRVDKKTGYYSEKDNEGKEIMRLATKNTWLKLLDVTKFALKKGLKQTYGSWENVHRVQGVSKNGKPCWLYSEDTIRKILAYIFDAEIKSKNGIHTRKTKVYRSAVCLSREVDVTAGNIKKRLLKAGCPVINGIDRSNGVEEELFDYSVFRAIFAEQLRVILTTNKAGDFTDDTYGRCVTVQRFCEKNPTVSREKLDQRLKSTQPTKLRRRDIRTHRLETLYPEKNLKALAKK